MKLDKGPRGFGFSLVAAPTFNSNVSENIISGFKHYCHLVCQLNF